VALATGQQAVVIAGSAAESIILKRQISIHYLTLCPILLAINS
jgi:hypothetical protein